MQLIIQQQISRQGKKMSKGKRTDISKQNEVLENVCEYFCFLQSQEQTLQAYREIITARIDFHPLSLFNYLSNGEAYLTKKHFLSLMEENSTVGFELEVKVWFGMYGFKEKIDFSGFLNYVYPHNLQSLKYISTVGLKRYTSINVNEVPCEEIICLFTLLFVQEMNNIQDLQNLKKQLFPNIRKSQIKKIIKSIKRICQNKSIYQIHNDQIIAHSELKEMLKKKKNMQEAKTLSICRRLSINKDHFVNFEQIEWWLKSWGRIKFDQALEKNNTKTLFEDIENSLIKS